MELDKIWNKKNLEFYQLTYMIAWITWSHKFGAEYSLSSTKEQHKWYLWVHWKHMECTVERFDWFHYWKNLQVFILLWITALQMLFLCTINKAFPFSFISLRRLNFYLLSCGRRKCYSFFDFKCHIQYICMSWIVMFGLFLAIFPTGKPTSCHEKI